LILRVKRPGGTKTRKKKMLTAISGKSQETTGKRKSEKKKTGKTTG